MSTGTDFLANLQKKTVKNTVQQKQQKRVNASAVDVSTLLEAALGKKKPVEAVADVRQSAEAATASFLVRPAAHVSNGLKSRIRPVVNFKIYTGYAAIPAYGTTLNCIMYSDKLDEFCNLMFRYFKINFGKQDLRIAEVLSASSATENRRPTTHRMLLSREEIKDKDLQIILPALELNYSTITVVKDRLESVGEISDDYQKIVNKIISESEKKETYFLAESDVKNIAKKYMKTSIEVKEFIMQVRNAVRTEGSSAENVGKKFLLVTAAVTGLGTAAVKTAADFDSEMSKRQNDDYPYKELASQHDMDVF